MRSTSVDRGPLAGSSSAVPAASGSAAPLPAVADAPAPAHEIDYVSTVSNGAEPARFASNFSS